MTVKLTLTEPKVFKDSINIISDLVNEVQITFDKDAVEIIAMDPANVAMIAFRLLASGFAEYELKSAETVEVNLSLLKQVLRRIKGGEILTMATSDGKLDIVLKGSSRRSFSLPIIDSDGSEQKVPELSFTVSIALPADQLNDAIEDVDVVADSVAFIAEKETFSLRSEGDLSKVAVDIPASDDVKLVVNGGADSIRSKYSVEYLKKMIQASKLADRVVVHFSKDYPLKLDYVQTNVLSMEFVLAPRVDTD